MKIICSLVLEGCGVSIVDPVTANTFIQSGLVIRPFEPSSPFSFRALSSSRISGTSLVNNFYEIFARTLSEE